MFRRISNDDCMLLDVSNRHHGKKEWHEVLNFVIGFELRACIG